MQHRSLNKLFLIGLAFFVQATGVLAMTWRVPDDLPNIEIGIDIAEAGDTVLVACGTYYEGVLHMKSGVILKGVTGEADCVIIEGGHVSCIDVDAAARIEGITFTHGWSEYGGGLYCRNSYLSIVRCDIVANIAGAGGGVYCDSSEVAMIDCNIADNQAVGIPEEIGPDGGGIVFTESSADTLRNCTISGNVADGYGGGVYCYGSPRISGCRINDNLAHSRGGGIYCGDGDGTDAYVENCWITGNAGGDGGGAHVRGTTTLIGCLVAGNTATWGYGYGGGISCRNHTGVINQCTIVGNEAISAGGIAFYGYGSHVSNCIIAMTVSGGGLGWGYNGPNSTPIITCCDIWGNIGGFGDAIQPEMIDGGGNISADPQFCGSSQPERPYSLAEASPCAPDNSPGCGLIGAFDVECSSGISVDEPSMGSAQSLFLANYPNPFNPRTTVSFRLPEAGRVRLVLYDAIGQMVVCLVDATLAPGAHQVDWLGIDTAGRPAPSGAYFCHLATPWGIETRKLQLLR